MPRGTKAPRNRTSRGPKRKAWFGTINNPKKDSTLSRLKEDATLPEGVSYIAFQLEKGEEGTPHYQVYIELVTGRHIAWLHTNIERAARWAPRLGTAVQASLYCTKDDTRVEGPWIIGKISKGAGSRTDIVDFKDAIRSGKRKRDLWETHTVQMCKYRHMYDEYRRCHRPVRTVDLTVALLVGDTGTGKTYTVYDNWLKTESFWTLPLSARSMWFDGYDGEKNVLLDDFAGKRSKVPLHILLQLLHEYVPQVEVKGSFVWWHLENIAITSNFHPREWYDWNGREKQYACLCRRLHCIRIFEEGEEARDLETDLEREEYFAQRDFESNLCRHDRCKLYDHCQFK